MNRDPENRGTVKYKGSRWEHCGPEGGCGQRTGSREKMRRRKAKELRRRWKEVWRGARLEG